VAVLWWNHHYARRKCISSY